MVRDVIAAVPDMAGVQADTKVAGELHTVNDLAQFFKAAADLASFSGHGFQKYRGGLLWF